MPKDKKNDIARIKFVNWQQLASINILIQDKNQQKFNIILSEQGNSIKPFDPIQVATEQDDIIVLPLDYRLNEKSLDAGDGNDIVTDISQRGHIIKGGKGNDIITVQRVIIFCLMVKAMMHSMVVMAMIFLSRPVEMSP